MREIGLIGLWQIVKLGVSIGVSVASGYIGWTDTAQEKLVVALLLFIMWNVLEGLVVVKNLSGRRDREQPLWRVEEGLDVQLINIRRSFRLLSRTAYGEKDLFVDHFVTTIDEVSQRMKEASETKSLRLRNYHFRSIENVLAAFEGSKAKTFMDLWILERGAPLFDNALAEEYFAQIAVMTKRAHIKSARTVFVFSDPACLEENSVRTLLAFYASWRGFDCRLVQKQSCDSLMTDEGIAGGCIDFGIYGERYLFKTTQYAPEVVGIFTKDAQEIRRYVRFFENLWNSAGARRNPEAARPGMGPEQIVGADRIRAIEG